MRAPVGSTTKISSNLSQIIGTYVKKCKGLHKCDVSAYNNRRIAKLSWEGTALKIAADNQHAQLANTHIPSIATTMLPDITN
jgi:hypothetical protein